MTTTRASEAFAQTMTELKKKWSGLIEEAKQKDARLEVLYEEGKRLGAFFEYRSCQHLDAARCDMWREAHAAMKAFMEGDLCP